MVEEEKQLGVHLAIAKRIVDTLADGDYYISQRAVLQVLKPLLEGIIGSSILEIHKIPELWFEN